MSSTFAQSIATSEVNDINRLSYTSTAECWIIYMLTLPGLVANTVKISLFITIHCARKGLSSFVDMAHVRGQLCIKVL